MIKPRKMRGITGHTTPMLEMRTAYNIFIGKTERGVIIQRYRRRSGMDLTEIRW
jgi:hypothetical protein